MGYRQYINAQIHRHRYVLLPLLIAWITAMLLTLILYLAGSFAIFFTKSSCFILSILLMAAYYGSGPRCPDCEDDFHSVASRFEIAVRWKKLPDSLVHCPKCGVEFD